MRKFSPAIGYGIAVAHLLSGCSVHAPAKSAATSPNKAVGAPGSKTGVPSSRRLLLTGDGTFFSSSALRSVFASRDNRLPSSFYQHASEVLAWMDSHPKTLAYLDSLHIPSTVNTEADFDKFVASSGTIPPAESTPDEDVALHRQEQEFKKFVEVFGKHLELPPAPDSVGKTGDDNTEPEPGGTEAKPADEPHSAPEGRHARKLLDFTVEYSTGVPPNGAYDDAAINAFGRTNTCLPAKYIPKVSQSDWTTCSLIAWTFAQGSFRNEWECCPVPYPDYDSVMGYFSNIKQQYWDPSGAPIIGHDLGVPPGDLVYWMHEEGGLFRNSSLSIRNEIGILTSLVDSGSRPIVAYDAPSQIPLVPSGAHYECVIGYDANNIVVEDVTAQYDRNEPPTRQYKTAYIPISVFLPAWEMQNTRNYIAALSLLSFASAVPIALLSGNTIAATQAIAAANFFWDVAANQLERNIIQLNAFPNRPKPKVYSLLSQFYSGSPSTPVSAQTSFQQPYPTQSALPQPSAPASTPTPVHSSFSAPFYIRSFSYLGNDTDKVGGGSGFMPDGTLDGHFRLDIDRLGSQTVGRVVVTNFTGSGSGLNTWDSLKQGTNLPLQVSLSGSDQINSPGQWLNCPISQNGLTLDLYADGKGSPFRSGDTVTVAVYAPKQTIGSSGATTIPLVLPTPTPIPTPKPTPRLPRYYSATSWVARNGTTANIIGATCNMTHVPLTATDKARGGVAGEVMWAKGQPGDWIEAGYSDRASASQSVFGRCFYWANANEAFGRYQDYRISDDSDATGDKRAYRVQRRVVNLGGPQYRLLYQVFQSDKNNTTAWKVVGLAGLFNEPILATDHGLEVTAKTHGTIGPNARCQIDGILHLLSGKWWAVNGTSYNVVPAQPDGTPVFKTIHNFADVRPTNNLTINYEVP